MFPSPHSGILFLSALMFNGNGGNPSIGFRPLIRGFFFYSWVGDNACVVHGFPSPHSGILFLSEAHVKDGETHYVRFPSPHSGILFLSKAISGLIMASIFLVSVPSFGDSFFIAHRPMRQLLHHFRFRPLIRGFFFYYSWYKNGCNPVVLSVSVPSFGDSFFIMNITSVIGKLIAGVSVPSFGDSFFILSL